MAGTPASAAGAAVEAILRDLEPLRDEHLDGVRGPVDPRGTHARPRTSKACGTWRPVCGAQRKVVALAEGVWLSALASHMWQRRTVKAS